MSNYEGKMFSIFNKTGKIQEITPISELPMFCKVLICSSGMCEYEGAVISKANAHGGQKVVKIDSYNPGFNIIDKYSRPISEKFGIGIYYNDDLETYTEEEVKPFILLAEQAAISREQKEIAKQVADKKEIEDLPGLYPYLTTLKNHPKNYSIACKDNIRADLKKNFPKIKFSVSGDRSSVDVRWTNGPTKKEVCKVLDKYSDHETDETGDYRDFKSTNFTKVFGGYKYIFDYRDMSDEIIELKPVLALLNVNNSQYYQNDQVFYEIFCKTSLPVNATNFKIELSSCTGGSIAEFYKITHS